MALEQDSNGFLVGTVVADIKRSRKNSDSLLLEVKKITDLLKKEGHLQAGNTDNSSTNASADAGSQQRTRRQNQRNNSGGASNSSQSESSGSASSENGEQPEQRRRESLRQKRERQRLERQQQRQSQQEQQADLSQNPPIPPTPSDNSGSEQSSNSNSHRQRDANGRFISESNDGSPEPITAGGDDETRGRDSRGRFAGGGAGGGKVDLEEDGDGNGGLGGLIGGLGDRITSAITAGQELQDVDPTIKAFQEVSEPLQRGYQFLFSGSSNKKDKPYFAWFNKLWGSLKSINKNTDESDDGGGDSGFSIMGIIQGIAMAAIAGWALFSKDGQALFSKIGELLAPIGKMIWDSLSPLAKQIMGFLIPIGVVILALFTPIGGMIVSVLGAVLMPIGGLIVSGIGIALSGIGSLIVAGIGLVFSPIGLAIIAAGTLAWGLFTEDGRAFFANIGGFIADSWNKGLELFASTFPEFTASAVSAWESIKSDFEPVIKTASELFGWLKGAWGDVIGFVSGIFESFANFMKDKFGIDIPAVVDVVTNKAKEITQPAFDKADEAKKAVTDFAESAKKSATETTETVKAFTSKLLDNAKSLGGAAVDSAGNVASNIGNSIIGTANASEKPYSGDASVGGNTAQAGQAKVSGKQEDMMKSVYSSFTNAGFSEDQAKALTAEVGRENAYNPKNVFGSHTDAANGATNTGFFSWQGNRSTALKKRLAGKGLLDGSGNMVHSQEALNEQAKFAKEEMESGQYKGLGNFMDNKNVDSDTAAKQLGKGYIKWAYGQDVLRNGTKFDWKSHDNRRAGYYNKLNTLVAGVDNPAITPEQIATSPKQTTPVTPEQLAEISKSQAAVTPQKTVLATPEQIQNAMPKAVQPVSAMPSIASISPIPSATTQSAKMPEMPSLVLPLSNNVKSSPTTIIPDVGQTVSDQHIAMISFPYATSMGNNK